MRSVAFGVSSYEKLRIDEGLDVVGEERINGLSSPLAGGIDVFNDPLKKSRKELADGRAVVGVEGRDIGCFLGRGGGTVGDDIEGSLADGGNESVTIGGGVEGIGRGGGVYKFEVNDVCVFMGGVYGFEMNGDGARGEDDGVLLMPFTRVEVEFTTCEL